MLESGGHFERFHPVQVEGWGTVLLGVGDDLDMEVSCVLFFFVVIDAVISWRGRDVFADWTCTNAYLSRDGSIFERFLHLR